MKNKRRSFNIIIEDCTLKDIYFENKYYKHHAYLSDELCDIIEDLYWDHTPITMCKNLPRIFQKYKVFEYLDSNSIFQNCKVNIYINDTVYQYMFYNNKLF